MSLSIDAFGTGYSSLSYVQRFPLDELKIDCALVHDLTQTRASRDLVAAIVAMGAALRLRLVAEGVETAEQAGELQRLGCHLAQGYLYAVPSTPHAIDRFLRIHRAGSAQAP